MKRIFLALSLLTASVAVSPANAAGAVKVAEFFPIGGVAIPNFFAEGEGQPLVRWTSSIISVVVTAARS